MTEFERGLTFRRVRTDAFESLSSTSRGTDGYPLLCVMQDRHEAHVPVYCNALSHVDALSDLLEYGSWCDDVVLQRAFADDDDTERLFRFFTSAFLVVDQCLEDIRDISKAAGGSDRLAREPHQLIGFINHVWKHRNTASGWPAAFHAAHHHGPYLYTDLPGYEAALPADGRYAGVGNLPQKGSEPLPVLVPSLVAAARIIGTQISALGKALERPEAREKLEATWSSDTA